MVAKITTTAIPTIIYCRNKRRYLSATTDKLGSQYNVLSCQISQHCHLCNENYIKMEYVSIITWI